MYGVEDKYITFKGMLAVKRLLVQQHEICTQYIQISSKKFYTFFLYCVVTQKVRLYISYALT